MKQKELAKWLKLIIVFCGLFGLLFCIFVGPEIGRNVLLESKSFKPLFNPFLVFIWITGVPYFIALCVGWIICSDISVGNDFTVENAKRLKLISVLAMIEGALYAVALLYTVIIRNYNTNLLMILLLILFFAIVISVFTSLLSYLMRRASEIKQDNEFTI
ncbi:MULTISPECIES: DUF2975 domain-containing protein [unclassified Viridibacillus]|uniref:DUF2975 domain-containing protein n=1 Tax=unclassified Viridibacillus TaxID=2617942 RepID=UPI00096F9E94|nr:MULTISPECIES: DUF2975 domain-containing protein [unclassified Viridibacillus]OMC84944.1 hypothetical protein BK130_04870 [Viridibacillus sp. FSL H8-0123]OMC85717.1 hypothetical protein BK128_13890 [Viridibacillus sp. FSL H7-0596]